MMNGYVQAQARSKAEAEYYRAGMVLHIRGINTTVSKWGCNTLVVWWHVPAPVCLGIRDGWNV